MASFQEIMEAAVNADKAGDATAAQMLVDLARGQGGSATPSGSIEGTTADPNNIHHVPFPDPDAAPSPPQVDNFGPTIEKATRGPRMATKEFARRTVAPGATPLDRAKNAGLTALSAAGTTYAFGAGLVGELIGGSPTNEKKLARDLMMMGEVAAPELAGVSGTVRAGSKAARAADQMGGPVSPVQETARAADSLGITPSLGAGGKVRGMTAATLEKVPGSGGVIARDAERFVGEVESVFSRIRNKVGVAEGAEGAGEALQEGLRGFVKGFKQKSEKLFDAVSKKIPADTPVPLDATASAINDVKQHFANNPKLAGKLGLNEWDGFLAEASANGINWQATRQLRTEIGNALGDNRGALADEGRARLKRLYGALTKDMESAANAAGPEARNAWKRANSFYRRGAERIERDLDKLISADSPERAFEAFANMTKKGSSSANAKRLYRIKSSMDAREWSKVSASIIDRLGRATDGAQNAAGDAFSPATFLTKWNKLTPEAKSVLLPAEARKEMTKLAQVAEGSKRAGAERNMSNTGTVLTGAAAGASLTQAPITTAALLGGAWASSKAMTSPMMLRALNKAARGDAKQLRAIARGNSPFAEDATTILRISAAEAAAGGSAANTEPTLQAIGQ